MRGPVFLTALAAAVCLAFVCWHTIYSPSAQVFTDGKASPPEPAPLCPWREPETDMKVFFPGATAHQTETRILSGLRLELADRLGRQMTGDENALRVNRIYQNDTLLGSVLTRRVKGEYGAIELVLATDDRRGVRGLRLQRLREPETNATVLQATNWLNAFVGKRAEDAWKIGADIPQVPSEAHESAASIVSGVRSLLVLLEEAEQCQTGKLAETHHH
jgi:hypothetical protein